RLSRRSDISRIDVRGDYFRCSRAEPGADWPIFGIAFVRNPAALQLCFPCRVDELHLRRRRRDMGVGRLDCRTATHLADTVRTIHVVYCGPLLLSPLGARHLRNRVALRRTIAPVGSTRGALASQN